MLPAMSRPAVTTPSFERERAAMARGLALVCGVDEAGRGPLAGPVVCAAVVLDPTAIPEGINDSKKLTAARREALFAEIAATAHVSVVAAPPVLIDRINIRAATLWAMREAVAGLAVRPDLALIDGRDIPENLPCPGEFLIGGDGISLSVAAASIVAKVTRDSMCPVMERDAPGYGFAGHKGYGTGAHLACLADLGPCRHHRQSFGPVARARAARPPAEPV